MPKSVTVNFEDGTSHVYDNVPDEISDADVQQRAAGEFNKSVGKVAQPQAAAPAEGAAPGAAPVAPGAVGQGEPTTGEKVVGGLATAGEIAMEHPGAIAGAGGAYKVYQLANKYVQGQNIAAKSAAEVAASRAETAAANQALQYQKMAARMPTAPVAPAGPQILNAAGQPMAPSAPIAPAGAAPVAAPSPVAQPTMMQRGADMASRMRTAAAQRVMPALNSMAKGGVLGAMATYSPELGPKTPQAGRMRGMEINPLTGAPWTAEQIAQYERNPNVFDAQMAPPQMRR